jgi:hypothetical protein
MVILEEASPKIFGRAGLNLNPPDLNLPSTWDYKVWLKCQSPQLLVNNHCDRCAQVAGGFLFGTEHTVAKLLEPRLSSTTRRLYHKALKGITGIQAS